MVGRPTRSQALPDVPRRRQDVGVCLASCWSKELHQNVAEHILGSRVKSSGNLRGQSEQNFEIYTVDWSQVSGWGLAAGGEALSIIHGLGAYSIGAYRLQSGRL